MLLAIVLMFLAHMGLRADLLDFLPTYRESHLGKRQVGRGTIGRWKSLGQRADERRNGLWRKPTDDLRRPHGDPFWFLGR